MRKKTYKVDYCRPEGDLQYGYILLPCGYFLNAEIQNASRGDFIKFSDGGQHRIVCIRKMSLKDELTWVLCMIRYGFSPVYLVTLWKDGMRYLGNGRSAVSEEECLFVAYGKESVNGK